MVVVLVLAAAVAHAGWNLIVKRAALGGVAFAWLMLVATAVILLPFAVATIALAAPADRPDVLVLLRAVAVSGALQLTYFLVLQAGYRAGDVSVVYPLARGTGPLLSVIFAIVLFAERPPLLALVGAAAVIAGVLVIGLAGGRSGRKDSRAGALWGLATGVAIAGYTLWDANAVTASGIAPVVLLAGNALVQSVVLAPYALRNPAARVRVGEVWRSRRRDLLIVAVLSTIAYLLILFALQLAPVSLVAPAREVSVVFVGIAGWLIFKEPHPVQRLIGAAVVLLGVAMLALPG